MTNWSSAERRSVASLARGLAELSEAVRRKLQALRECRTNPGRLFALLQCSRKGRAGIAFFLSILCRRVPFFQILAHRSGMKRNFHKDKQTSSLTHDDTPPLNQAKTLESAHAASLTFSLDRMAKTNNTKRSPMPCMCPNVKKIRLARLRGLRASRAGRRRGRGARRRR